MIWASSAASGLWLAIIDETMISKLYKQFHANILRNHICELKLNWVWIMQQDEPEHVLYHVGKQKIFNVLEHLRQSYDISARQML